MAKITYLTKEGLKNLKEELDYLQYVKRPDISRQIAEARDKGDLSENAEYDAAKEAQGLLEMQIAQKQEILRNARLLDESKIDPTKIQIHSIVTIKNLKNNTTMQYTIVAESEANLRAGKISISSPIAKGLLGKEKGDKAQIKVPSGLVEFEIIDVSR